MNIVRHFYSVSRQYPQHTAIADKRGSVTYGELFKQVTAIKADLTLKGVKPGDCILVVIPLSISLYAHILAIFSLGATVVLVDRLKPKQSMVRAYTKANCSMVLTISWIARLKHLLLHPSLWKHVTTTKSTQDVADDVPFNVSTEDSALITFTSGSTGNPKAANRTHGFLDIQLSTLIDEMQLVAGDIHVTSFPVVLMCNLAVGATSLIIGKHPFNTSFQPTILSASPFYVTSYLSVLQTNNLSRIFIGGASVFPSLVSTLEKIVPRNMMHFVFGSTEAEPIALLNGSDYTPEKGEPGLCVGKPHPNISVLIAHISSDTLTPLKDKEVGEILVAGNHVLPNYFKDEQATRKHKIDYNGQRWHRTGDAGYFNDGKLYYFGRYKLLWRHGDTLVSPIVLEKFLSINFPSVEGTWLNVEGNNIAFLNYSAKKLSEIDRVREQFPYSIDHILFVKSIPKDHRHLSRVDYEKLRLLALKKRF